MNTLNSIQRAASADLAISGRIFSIQNFEIVNLQKAVIAVGLIFIFESTLQIGLDCDNGFKEAKAILIKCGENILNERFQTFIDAINILKHEKGYSYNA